MKRLRALEDENALLKRRRLSPAYLIRRYTVARRSALIFTLLIDLEAQLIDAALEIADELIAKMFRRVTTMQQRAYTASSREVARLVRLLYITVNPPIDADKGCSGRITAPEGSFGWPALIKKRGQAREIADIVEQDPLIVAGDKYETFHKFAPLLIKVLEFKSGHGRAASVKATCFAT